MNATIEKPDSAETNLATPLVSSADRTPASRPVRKILFIVLGLLALFGAAQFIYRALVFEKSDDAFIAAHLHLISPQISGKVTEVSVEENQPVKKGDILVKIDPLEFELARDKAQAALIQAQAQLTQAQVILPYAEAQVAVAQSHVAEGNAQLQKSNAETTLATSNLARNKQLFGSGRGVITQADIDASQSAFDSAQAAENAARSNLAALQSSVESAKALLQAAPAQAAASRASVDAAQATLRDAERQLSYTVIRAPADGRIGNRNVEVGNRVQLGQAIFSVVESEVWVVANFKETQLPLMKIGQPVEIRIDALPEQDFHGRVDSFSPGTGSLFTLLPPDNATGNFTKVVQRVPVKILLDPSAVREVGGHLRAGLSAIVSVRVRQGFSHETVLEPQKHPSPH